MVGDALSNVMKATLTVTFGRRPADDDKLDAILRVVQELRRLLVTLTANEQRAVNDLSSAVETLATDLGQVETTTQQAMADLHSQIDALSQQHGVDAQTIATLQSAVDSAEQDIVGALSPITQRVSGIDQDLKSPASPQSPLTAQS